ncbi:MAG: hypothetical protein GC157_17745 [Frankiales bacterium]|nr:hypothetical protein [Frankiales bacterium]
MTSLALVAAIVAARYFAATSVGVDRDLVNASNQLPIVLRLAINVVGGFGIVLLPLAAAIDLLLGRRTRQLVDALGALLVAVAVSLIANQLPAALASGRPSITFIPVPAARHLVFVPVLAGLVAFVTVARLLGRGRWGWFASVMIGAVAVMALAVGSTTTSEIVVSLLTGWVVGLATRYALGTPSTQPTGAEVVDALGRVGLPVARLSASSVTGRGRRYEAVTHSRDRLRVQVFDRDLEGAGLAGAAWRQLRLRTEPSGTGVSSLRGQTEHAALLSLAATAAGVPVPRLLAVGKAGPDSTLLAYDQVSGATFDTLVAEKVTDADLDAMYQMVLTLHTRGIVHRSLSAENFISADDGRVWLAGIHDGAIAASDVQQRIDLAELLCTTTLLTNAERAVAAGARTFGADQLARALPALQPFAFSTETRRRVQAHQDVLVAIRDQLLTLQPSTSDAEPLDLRRFKPRSVVTIVAGALAAYLLVSQLAGVDLVGLLRSGDWRWSGLAAFLSVLTFVGASFSLSGFVPETISYGRTFAAQWAAGFATLVSPPAVGTVAVNVRYLRRSGLHPALAAASVGVSQVFALLTHTVLLIATAVLAGQSAQLRLAPSRTATVTVFVVLAIGLLVMIGPLRGTVVRRVRPILTEVGPRLVSIGQRPWKVVEGVSGILLLNAAFAGSLIASVKAFSADNLNYSAVALVYLAGSTLGQAAPTPGGLGAVELAYVAGLTAAGIAPGVAVSATLLFRLLTFWLPVLPGYWSLHWLQRIGSL